MRDKLIIDRRGVENLLIKILSSELFDKEYPLDFSSDVWSTLTQVAMEQSVLGIVLHYITTHNLSLEQDCIFQTVAWQCKIDMQNELVKKKLVEVVDVLKKNGVDIYIVKGPIVGQCYPFPNCRQSGDIDFCCDAQDVDRCCDAIVSNLNVDIKSDHIGKHDEFIYNGVIFEMHKRLVNFAVKKHQTYFEHILDKDKRMEITIDDEIVQTLSPTVNTLYLFIHLYFHLIEGGIGLRHVCDLSMWLHKYRNEIDKDSLVEWLTNLHLLAAFRVLCAVMMDYIKLPEDDVPLAISDKDRKRGNEMLKDMFKMGNFGVNKESRQKTLGVLHSMQSGLNMLLQGWKYVDLTPREVIFRVPQMIKWYVSNRLAFTNM